MPESVLTRDHDYIAAAVASGTTITDIADALDVPRKTLSDYVHKHVRANGDFARARRTGPVQREETLEAELRELRAAATKDRKGLVQSERFMSALEAALAEVVPPSRTLIHAPDERPDEEAHHRQLVVWSDWHGGEIVNREAVNGVNRYDWQIQEERVEQLVAALHSHRQNSPALTGLDIVLAGDMCSGSNHLELAVTNQYPLAVQGVKMGYLIGRTIEQLVPYYQDVNVVAVVGNHPRLAIKPAAKNVHDNMDWIAYWIAAEYLRDYDTVDFHVPDSAAVFHKIAGRTFYVWHGDGIRSSMPGVPWGGVMRRTDQLRRQHADRKIDGWILGHFHQANAMIDLGIFMNGALKGTDEWSLKNFGGGGQPSQLLLTFDEKRSRLTDVRLITPTAGLA